LNIKALFNGHDNHDNNNVADDISLVAAGETHFFTNKHCNGEMYDSRITIVILNRNQ